MPKKEVLDSQGRAVEKSIRHMGGHITSCLVGKYIVLDLPVNEKTEALNLAKKMTNEILCNPLIESYELEAL